MPPKYRLRNLSQVAAADEKGPTKQQAVTKASRDFLSPSNEMQIPADSMRTMSFAINSSLFKKKIERHRNRRIQETAVEEKKKTKSSSIIWERLLEETAARRGHQDNSNSGEKAWQQHLRNPVVVVSYKGQSSAPLLPKPSAPVCCDDNLEWKQRAKARPPAVATLRRVDLTPEGNATNRFFSDRSSKHCDPGHHCQDSIMSGTLMTHDDPKPTRPTTKLILLNDSLESGRALTSMEPTLKETTPTFRLRPKAPSKKTPRRAQSAGANLNRSRIINRNHRIRYPNSNPDQSNCAFGRNFLQRVDMRTQTEKRNERRQLQENLRAYQTGMDRPTTAPEKRNYESLPVEEICGEIQAALSSALQSPAHTNRKISQGLYCGQKLTTRPRKDCSMSERYAELQASSVAPTSRPKSGKNRFRSHFNRCLLLEKGDATADPNATQIQTAEVVPSARGGEQAQMVSKPRNVAANQVLNVNTLEGYLATAYLSKTATENKAGGVSKTLDSLCFNDTFGTGDQTSNASTPWPPLGDPDRRRVSSVAVYGVGRYRPMAIGPEKDRVHIHPRLLGTKFDRMIATPAEEGRAA